MNSLAWHNLLCLAATLALCSAASLSFAQSRFALVIGNADYSIDTQHTADLATPVANARFMADTLDELGWQVFEPFEGEEMINLSLPRIRDEVENFTTLPLRGADVLVFFSGHGFSIGDRNYILGTPRGNPDVYSKEWHLEDNGFEVSRLIASLKSANPRRIIVIIDACSDRPPISGAQNMVTTGQNFGFEQDDEIAVIYSSAPGGVAYESLGRAEGALGPSRYSVFTRYFVPRIREGGSLVQAFFDVRQQVIKVTRDAQQDRAISSGYQQPTYDDSGAFSPDYSLSAAVPLVSDDTLPREDPEPELPNDLWREEPSICATDREQLAEVLKLRDSDRAEAAEARAVRSCIVNAALADLGVKDVSLFGASDAAVRISVEGEDSSFRDGDGVATILVANGKREIIETLEVEDVAGFEAFIARFAFVEDRNVAFNVFREGRYRYVIHSF